MSKVPVLEQFDGWERTKMPHGQVHFLHTPVFDVCVWKGYRVETKNGSFEEFEDTWQMSCHRQFGFSAKLDADDERTAKLEALSKVQAKCREGAFRAAQQIKETADKWAKKNKKLPPLREMPFGKPTKLPCEICGAVPTLPLTKLCGPCTFGDPATAGGNW